MTEEKLKKGQKNCSKLLDAIRCRKRSVFRTEIQNKSLQRAQEVKTLHVNKYQKEAEIENKCLQFWLHSTPMCSVHPVY